VPRRGDDIHFVAVRNLGYVYWHLASYVSEKSIDMAQVEVVSSSLGVVLHQTNKSLLDPMPAVLDEEGVPSTLTSLQSEECSSPVNPDFGFDPKALRARCTSGSVANDLPQTQMVLISTDRSKITIRRLAIIFKIHSLKRKKEAQ